MTNIYKIKMFIIKRFKIFGNNNKNENFIQFSELRFYETLILKLFDCILHGLFFIDNKKHD